MSDTIDNRVVQLDLENASFERNAKKSIKTLDELDKSLEFKNGKRGFEDVERAAEKTNFASLIAAADTVTHRLSALGVVGVTALQNITNKAIDAGTKLAKSLSVDQVMAGYSKYEQKTASVQTLVNATGKSVDAVNEYLSKLMWFSDETSYGFTDMTQALSTMVTSGGNINKLIPMIMGVANSVAFAGKGASEFSRVMYNLNQSYSAGALKYADWRSIELAGAASKELKQAFIDTAVAQKKLKKGKVNIANFAMTLKDNWLDNKVMEKTFGDMAAITQKAYEMVQSGQVDTASEAYEILSKEYDSVAMRAALAAQQAKTLTEAIDSVKDAVSTGWMTTFETIFGDYSRASRLWTTLANDLWNVFASGGEKRNDFLADVFDSGFQKIQKTVSSAGIAIDDLSQAMLEVAEGKGVDLGAAIHEYGNLDAAIRNVEGGADIARAALTKMSDDNQKTLASASKQLDDYKKFTDKYVKGKAWWTKNEKTAMKQAAKQGYDWAIVQELMSKTNADLKNHYIDSTIELDAYNDMLELIAPNVLKGREFFDQLSDSTSALNEQFDDFYKRNGTELIADSLHNVLQAVINIRDIAGKAWENVFGEADTGSIFNVMERITSFTKRLNDFVEENDKIQAGLESVFRILHGGVNVVGAAFDVFGSLARAIGRTAGYVGKLEPVAKVLKRIKEIVFGNARSAPGFLDSVTDYLRNLSAAIDAFDPARFPIIAKGVNLISTGFQKAGIYGHRFYKAIKPAFPILLNGLSSVGRFMLGNVFEPFANFVSDLITSEDPLAVLKNGLQSAWDWMKRLYSTGKQLVRNVLSKLDVNLGLGESESVVETLLDLFDNLKTKIDSIIKNTDFGTLLAGIAGLGVFLSIIKITEAFSQLGDAAGAVKTSLNNFNKIFKKHLGGTFASNLNIVAGAITSLAFAVVLMALVPADKLWGAVKAVAALTAIMAALSIGLLFVSKYISKKDNKSLTTLAKSMLIMSISIMLIAKAGEKLISAFSGIEGFGNQLGTMLASLLYLVGMASILAGMAFLLNMTKGKIAIGATVLVLLAVAILAFVKAVGLLNNVDLGASLGVIVTLAVGLAAVAVLFSTIGSKTSGPILKFAAAILFVTAAFAIAVYALQKLMDAAAQLKFSGKAIVVLLSVIGGLILVGLACFLLSKVLEPTVKTAAMIGVAVLAVVGAMFLMELLMERISNMSKYRIDKSSDALLKIAIGLGILMAAMAAIAWASDGGKGVFKIAASLFLVVAAFAVFVGIFALISKLTRSMPESDINKATGVLWGIGLLIAIMALALGGAAKLGGGKVIAVVISVLLGLFVVFGLFAVMIVLVKHNDFTAIATALGAVFVLALIVGGLALAIGKAAQLAGNGKSAAVKLIGMIFVIVAVGAALGILANQPVDGLLAATVGMIAVVGMLALLMYTLGKTKVEWDAIAKLVVVAITMIAVIGMFAVVAKMLDGIKPSELFWNMLILVGAIVVLAGAATALGAFSGGIAVAALAGVAAGLICLGAAVLIFAGAAWVFADAMHKLEDLQLTSVAENLGALGKAAGWTILAAVAIGLFGIAAGIAAPGIDALAGAMTGLLTLLGAVGRAWEAGGGSFLGMLANIGPELDAIAESSAAASDEMSSGLESAVDDMVEAGSELAEAASDSTAEVAEAIDEAAPEVAEAATEAVEAAGDAAAEAAPCQVNKIMSAIMQSGPGGLKSLVSGFLSSKGGDSLGGFDISSLTDNFDLEGLLGGAVGNVDMGNVLSNLDFGSVSPEQLNAEGLTSAVQTATDTALSGVDTNSSAQSFVQQFMSSTATFFGGSESITSLRDSGTRVADEVGKGAKTVNMTPIGSYMVQGIINGIDSLLPQLRAKANEIATLVDQIVRKKAQIKSPSRVMMEDGRYMTAGLAIGIENAAGMVKKAALRVASITDETMAESDGIVPVLDMSDVYNTMDEFDGVWRPTIRPTLDMSGVNPGVLNAQAVASQQASGYRLDGTPSAAASQNPTPASFNFTQNNYSPKPLSRTEIYRQTKNQFASIEGLVSTR